MEKTEAAVRERHVKIQSKKGGKPVSIAQITDLHVSVVCEDDMEDLEIARTYFRRKWLRDGAAVPAAKLALDACRDADCTVVSGDLIDYYSFGAASAMKELFDAHPNVMACIGGHDVTLEMETGRKNELPLADRYALLEAFWPNDVQFAVKTLADKVTLVVLNNNVELYLETRTMFDKAQVEKLRQVIDEARREDRIVLLFMHEPLCPGHDRPIVDIVNGQDAGVPRTAGTGTGKEGYDLIVSSSDVIRGVFVGHRHCDYETEIEAGYEENGQYIKQNIPMYGLTANCYTVEGKVGHVMRIEVE